MALSRQVLIFLIDGLRPEALRETDTPAMERIAAAGTRYSQARTVSPEISLPCITSLIHSLPPQEHGILDNTFKPLPGDVPGLFDLVKGAGLSPIAVYSWEPLRDLGRPDSLDFSYYHRHADPIRDGRELEMAAVAADYLVSDRPALAFIYLELPDLAGHAYGWMSNEYLEAAGRADRAVELVLEELSASNMMEETSMILLADHGGHGNTHGDAEPGSAEQEEDRRIPLLLSGAGIRKGESPQVEASILDVAPTVARLLGLEIPAGWRGRVLTEALEP